MNSVWRKIFKLLHFEEQLNIIWTNLLFDLLKGVIKY